MAIGRIASQQSNQADEFTLIGDINALTLQVSRSICSVLMSHTSAAFTHYCDTQDIMHPDDLSSRAQQVALPLTS